MSARPRGRRASTAGRSRRSRRSTRRRSRVAEVGRPAPASFSTGTTMPSDVADKDDRDDERCIDDDVGDPERDGEDDARARPRARKRDQNSPKRSGLPLRCSKSSSRPAKEEEEGRRRAWPAPRSPGRSRRGRITYGPDEDPGEDLDHRPRAAAAPGRARAANGAAKAHGDDDEKSIERGHGTPVAGRRVALQSFYGAISSKLGSKSSMTAARSAKTEASPSSWMCPAAARASVAGFRTTPTSAALGPETVSWVSGEAPRRALSTPCRTHTVQAGRVGEREVDAQVDVDGLVADEVDTGEVEQQVERHRHDGVGEAVLNAAGSTPSRSSRAAVRKMPRHCGPRSGSPSARRRRPGGSWRPGCRAGRRPACAGSPPPTGNRLPRRPAGPPRGSVGADQVDVTFG